MNPAPDLDGHGDLMGTRCAISYHLVWVWDGIRQRWTKRHSACIHWIRSGHCFNYNVQWQELSNLAPYLWPNQNLTKTVENDPRRMTYLVVNALGSFDVSCWLKKGIICVVMETRHTTKKLPMSKVLAENTVLFNLWFLLFCSSYSQRRHECYLSNNISLRVANERSASYPT